MPKKTAKTETKTEATPSPASPVAAGSGFETTAVVGLPKFNPHTRPASGATEQVSTTPIRQSYEDVQRAARGPGVEEWKQADKLRADLAELYNTLREDDRYAPEYKAESAWKRYEETRAQVEKLAPEARQKMLKSAEGLERMSIPTPECEGIITKDTNKLLLRAHERDRLEGLISRQHKMADKGPLKGKSPADVLKEEYERGLRDGGPGGGATVRAVIGLVRDWGLDLDGVVDAQRKAHHRGALEDAHSARIRADMIGRTVPEPPASLKKGTQGGSPRRNTGTYAGAPRTLVPREKPTLFKKQRPLWK